MSEEKTNQVRTEQVRAWSPITGHWGSGESPLKVARGGYAIEERFDLNTHYRNFSLNAVYGLSGVGFRLVLQEKKKQ